MSVSMTMNGAVLPVMALYIVAAEEQGVEPQQAGRDDPERHPQGVHGSQYVHLSSRAEHPHHRGHLPSSPARTDAEVQQHQHQWLPHAGSRGRRPIWNSPTHLADGLEYVRTGCSGRDSNVDAFCPRLSFFWAIGMNYFMEVAKLRAARMIWAKLIKQFSAQELQEPVAAHP